MVSVLQKPCLVTGASGLVGNNLVRHLLNSGRQVRVFVRQAENKALDGLEVETVVGDILQPEVLKQAMTGVSSVFHLAGAISIDGQQDAHMKKVNVEGTANVVDASLQTGVERLIHFSSIHAFSWSPKDQPIDETREPALDPKIHLAYDQSKAAGEQKVLAGVEKGLNAVILNPVGIFGPNDFGPSPSGEFLQQLMQRKLPGLVQSGYFWVDVRDVVLAAVAAETKGRSGERYILHGEYGAFISIADWVHETSGARPPILNAPMWLARSVAPLVVRYSRWRGIRPLVTPEAIQIVGCHQKISTTKAASELEFQPRPLKETIADTVRWLQDFEQPKENFSASSTT